MDRAPHDLRCLALACGLACACGPRAAEPEAHEGSETTNDDDGDTTTASVTTDAETEGTHATDLETQASSESTGDPPGQVDCRPFPETGDRAQVEITLELTANETLPIGAPRRCSVETALTTHEGVRLSFACEGSDTFEHVTLGTTPPIAVPLEVGDDVTIRHATFEDPPAFTHTFLRVDRARFGHVLTFIESSRFVPDAFEFPLPLARIVPTVSCSDDLWTPCGERDRVGLEFQARADSDDRTLLFEFEHATLADAPESEVWVALAATLQPATCGPPDQWYRVLVATRP